MFHVRTEVEQQSECQAELVTVSVLGGGSKDLLCL